MAATGAARLSRSEVVRFDWDISDLSSDLFVQEFLDTPTTLPPPVTRRRFGVLVSF